TSADRRPDQRHRDAPARALPLSRLRAARGAARSRDRRRSGAAPRVSDRRREQIGLAARVAPLRRPRHRRSADSRGDVRRLADGAERPAQQLGSDHRPGGRMTGFLALEDGTVFHGESVGAEGAAFGEAVFTTAMSGYQETVTDPSYAGQIVCFTAPMVGNYGVASDRSESGRAHVRAVLMREARGPQWAEWLRSHGIVG